MSSIVKSTLVESIFKKYAAHEKTLQYFDRSIEAKAERIFGTLNQIINVLK